MKKVFIVVIASLLMSSCGLTKTATSSSTTTPQTAAAAPAQTAVSSGQGAGNALLNLYNQYKADGKFDYQNMQNILNTVTLIANCEGLKTNYKDKEYLKDFGKGMIASSLGLVTQDNVETVTNSLVDMVKNSETVQEAKTQTQSTASTAAGYANTAAQYAGALSTLLGTFAGK